MGLGVPSPGIENIKRSIYTNRLARFESYCRHWVRRFGLTEWVITYQYGASEGYAAEVQYNTQSRQATILLAKDANERELNYSALHETWHLLMADLTKMAEGAVSGDRVLCEEHKIIARFENYIREDCMAKKSKGKKKGCK